MCPLDPSTESSNATVNKSFNHLNQRISARLTFSLQHGRPYSPYSRAFSCIHALLPFAAAPSLCRTDQEAAPGASVVQYGKPNPSQESCDALDLDICPDLLLAAIAAFGAIAFLTLYLAITMNGNGRRRRRSLRRAIRNHDCQTISQVVHDGRSKRPKPI